GQRHVLERLVPEQARVVAHEVEGMDERHAVLRLAHGVITRWRRSSSPSAASASATASAPAAISSVVKFDWSAWKMGEPRPLSTMKAPTVARLIVVTAATRRPA